MDLSLRQYNLFDRAFHIDPKVVDKNLDQIFEFLKHNDWQKLDAFAIAWDGAPPFLRVVCINEVDRLAPGFLAGITPDTKAANVATEQRQQLIKVLVKLSDAGTITAGRMLAIREFKAGIAETQEVAA